MVSIYRLDGAYITLSPYLVVIETNRPPSTLYFCLMAFHVLFWIWFPTWITYIRDAQILLPFCENSVSTLEYLYPLFACPDTMGWLIQRLDNYSPGVNENYITYTSMPSFVKADTSRPTSHSICWRRRRSVDFFISRRFMEWRAIFELWIKQDVEESRPGLFQGVYYLRIWLRKTAATFG